MESQKSLTTQGKVEVMWDYMMARALQLLSLTERAMAASFVTSRVRPSAKVAWTTNDCRSRAVARRTSGG